MARNKFFFVLAIAILVIAAAVTTGEAQTDEVPLITIPDLDNEVDGSEIPEIIEVPLIESQKENNDDSLPDNLVGTLNVLDKVTARTSELRLPINEAVRLKNLVITMRSCKTAPPEEEPETTMFLEVVQDKDGIVETIFMGWMFASSPGIHALEHPIYDVWPLSCNTSDGLIFSGK